MVGFGEKDKIFRVIFEGDDTNLYETGVSARNKDSLLAYLFRTVGRTNYFGRKITQIFEVVNNSTIELYDTRIVPEV